MSNTKTALVLGGGGSLGAIEVGFIKRLRELGCEFDLLVGTSVGALNASHVAFHEQDSHDCLSEVWQGLAGQRLYSRNPLQLLASLRRSRLGLYDAGFLRRLIRAHLADDRIENARVPLRITATDICSGERRVFASGSLTQAVMASTAVPGLFPPVTIDGRMYVDGGVTSGGDIAAAVAEGATTVVFIDLRPMFRDQCPRTVLEVITRSFELLAEDRAACAAEHRDYPAEVVHIQPGLTSPRGDFSDAPRLLEESYRMACLILDRCRVGGRFKAGHYHGAAA
ncbi:MAG: patatin-like phospholipase family protein [Dehalococcoidia bacterium]